MRYRIAISGFIHSSVRPSLAYDVNKPRRAIRCVLQAEIIVFVGFSLMVTDGRTYGWTDGRTDRPSYRDARTHLKNDCMTSSLGK